MFPYTRVCKILTIAALVLVQQAAYGQRGGGAPPPAGGTTPGAGQGRPSTGTTGQSPSPTSPGSGRPIFLSGRVMLEDGTAPPGRVAIERVCGATIRVEGYADVKGYFSFQLGNSNADVFPDASVSGGLHGDPGDAIGGRSGGLNERDLLNCELRAQLGGYESQSIQLGTRRVLDNPDVGTILMRRIGQSPGTTVSATTLAAPKDARKAYEKGLDLAKKKKLPEAQTDFEKAVALYPRYALAWSELGRIQAAQGQVEAARTSFNQSIAADAKFVVPYVEISALEYRARRWQELADTSEKAVALDPFHYPQIFFLNAVANYNLHNTDRAEESARRAQKLDVNHQIPQISHFLGVILAERQNYTAAAAEMRDYLKFAPQAPDAADVRSQLEQLEQSAKANPGAPAQ
jgi:tetratricopeptide (TPR) repeat protein